MSAQKTIEYRRPRPEDFGRMVELQGRSLLSQVDPSDLSGGFLASAFTAEQFEAMDRSVGVIVALDGEKLCGYVCGSTPEFNRDFAVPAAMFEKSRELIYQGKPLSSYRCYSASPICIDAEYRGSGVYVGLCRAIMRLTAGRYDVALGPISTLNERHLNAIKKIPLMETVGSFTAKGLVFQIVAIRMPAA